MNYFEKFVFLELTWRQFAKLDSAEYYKTIKLLSKEEEDLSIKIGNEIHQIYNFINFKIEERKSVNSIIEYHEEVAPVSEVILRVSKEFGLSLKGEVSEEFKKSVLKFFGKEFLDSFLDKSNQ